jgi:hypothetical protein
MTKAQPAPDTSKPAAAAGRNSDTGDEVASRKDNTEDEAGTSSDEESSSSTKTSDWLRFAFGNDTHWALWGKNHGWSHTNATQAISAIKDLELEELYNIALTREGGWIVTGQTKERACCVAYYKITSGSIAISEARDWVKSHDGYQKMFELLNRTYGAGDPAIVDAKFTTGPHGAWWAKLSSGTHHHNLPSRLQNELEKAAKDDIYPEHIALGYAGSYVALWSDLDVTWQLIGYDELHERLQEGAKDIEFVALSPMYNTEFLYVQTDGSVCYNVSLGVDGNRDVRRETNNYMQRRAKSNGTTISILGVYGLLLSIRASAQKV